MERIHRNIKSIAAVLLLLCLITACRKGSDTSSNAGDVTSTGTPSTTSTMTTIQGTASVGAPLAGAAVVLRDALGSQKTVITGALGDFSADVSGFTAPVLLKVASTPNSSLYGIAMQSGVANLHPYSDLLLRGWYGVKGYDLVVEFERSGAIPLPAATEINSLEAGLRKIIASWLRPFNVDPAGFNLLTSPFNADGTGFDGLLHILKVDLSGGTVKLYPVDPNYSTNYNPIFTMPTGSDLASSMQSVSDGILQTLTSWKDAINTKGAAITTNDLLPLYSSQYLNDGSTTAQDIAGMLPLVRNDQIATVALHDIITMDALNGIVFATWNMTLANGATRTIPSSADRYFSCSFKFVTSAGKWLFYGNQRDVRAQFHVGVRKQVLAATPGSPVVSPIIDSVVTAATGSVNFVYITGPNLSTNPTYFTKTTNGMTDTFSFPWDMPLTSSPLVGSVYTLKINMTNQTLTLNQIIKSRTMETFTITTPAGNTLADAKIGSPLSVSWTKPTTFAIVYTQLSGSVINTLSQNNLAADVELSPLVSSGTITLPSVNGTAFKAWIQINMEGEHGEYSVSRKEFGN